MEDSRTIFCVTHPRACSTAFERVFMTREDLTCVHEPFGDAFYYGPERMSPRFEDDKAIREKSGFQDSTYKTIFDRLDRDSEEGKRLFIKDIIYYWLAPDGAPAQLAPSLLSKRRGVGTDNGTIQNGESAGPPFPYGSQAEDGNPTVIPSQLMRQFRFSFLIRNPHNSIPSFYRCTIPPLREITGFHQFDPAEAGYNEVRRVFDYLIESGQVGPRIAGQTAQQANGHTPHVQESGVEICLIDADDLLDNPEGIIKAYCESVGLKYSSKMLNWDNQADHDRAAEAFEKWKGWHEDALDSKDLKPRTHKKKQKTENEWDAEWRSKYGEEGAKLIRETVDKNMPDYLYLKQFAIKV